MRVLVEAHAVPHPNTNSREPVLYLRYLGGADLQHHALAENVRADETVLEELHREGWLDIDYRDHEWHIVPTPTGRRVIEQHDRVTKLEPLADVSSIVDAVSTQFDSENKLGWPAVRPVLLSLRGYWEAAGFSPHGIQLPAVLVALPEEHLPLFVATVRALVSGDYLRGTTSLLTHELPAEVALTDRAHVVVDGWPGAPPDELAENLLAVLENSATVETDPVRRRRLQRLAETVREVGVSTAGEVLAKVMLGG
jgi:hypothetical protein